MGQASVSLASLSNLTESFKLSSISVESKLDEPDISKAPFLMSLMSL